MRSFAFHVPWLRLPCDQRSVRREWGRLYQVSWFYPSWCVARLSQIAEKNIISKYLKNQVNSIHSGQSPKVRKRGNKASLWRKSEWTRPYKRIVWTSRCHANLTRVVDEYRLNRIENRCFIVHHSDSPNISSKRVKLTRERRAVSSLHPSILAFVHSLFKIQQLAFIYMLCRYIFIRTNEQTNEQTSPKYECIFRSV